MMASVKNYTGLVKKFFTHSSVDGHLGYFHVLAIVNSAAMNTEVRMSFGIVAFLAFSGSDIVGSYGRYILRFLRKKRFYFHSISGNSS